MLLSPHLFVVYEKAAALFCTKSGDKIIFAAKMFLKQPTVLTVAYSYWPTYRA